MSALRPMLDALALLTPYELEGEGKVRVGDRRHDGGYVFVDRLRPEQVVHSFGIGRNVAFDLDFAGRGHDVFLYDHTIEGPPRQHARFHFAREGIGGASLPGEPIHSLEDHLRRRGHARCDMILKLDVEGHEWRVFDETPQAVLLQFEQIVFEAHRLERLGFREGGQRMLRGLQRLAETHTLFHVHANNVRPPTLVEGLPIPSLMELSYIRSDLVVRRPNRTVHPTALDRPNASGRPETPLFFYPFLPMAAGPDETAAIAQQLADCADRLDAQAREAARRARQRAAAAIPKG
jgi:hypothetical protein